jgi:peptide/nickel transport system substrate-binding protein
MAKKLIALLLCAVMLLGAVACSSQTETAAPAGGDSSAPAYKEDVVFGTPYEFVLTDPQGSNLDAPMTLFTLTHETLTDLDNGNVIPHLATWEQEDATHIKFTIPDNVTFTNGEPCTTEDIAFTFERAKESSFTSGKIATLDHTEIISPTEILFVLSAPNQDFLTTLAHKSLSILSKKAVEADPTMGPSIGTGCFKLVEWIPLDVTKVERYEGYHGEKPPAKTITFRHISESSSAIIALQNGEVDVILGIPTVQATTIENDPNCDLVQIPDVMMKYFTFNVEKPPFDDVRVRTAIAHAVNKQNIIDGVFEGKGQVWNSVVNVGQFGLDETIPELPYDTEAAKKMLAEAGFPDGIDIKMICYKGDPYETIAQILQADMAPAGIRISIEPLEPAAQKAAMKEGTHEIAVYAWTDADGTDFTVRSLLYSTSGSNRAHIKDPELDKMIDAALVEMDVATREQMYKDIQKYVDNLHPYVPLCTSVISCGVRKGTTGIGWKSTNKHDYRYVAVPVG